MNWYKQKCRGTNYLVVFEKPRVEQNSFREQGACKRIRGGDICNLSTIKFFKNKKSERR